jgi:hypothetical protein
LDHIKIIAAAVGAVILGVALWQGVSWYTAGKEARLANALSEITSMGNASQRIDELKPFLDDAPAGLQAYARLALVNSLMEEKRYQEAENFWADLRKKGTDELKIVAAFGQAKCLTLQEKYDQALDILLELKKQNLENFKLVLAQETATVAELARNWDQALKAYDELKTMEDNVDMAFVDYKIKQIQARKQG